MRQRVVRSAAEPSAPPDWAVHGAAPQAFRWRLSGATPFPVERALHLGEAVRNGVMAAAERHGCWPLPDWLPGMASGSGRGDRGSAHRCAT